MEPTGYPTFVEPTDYSVQQQQAVPDGAFDAQALLESRIGPVVFFLSATDFLDFAFRSFIGYYATADSTVLTVWIIE